MTSKQIKKIALDIGFDLVGITSPEPIKSAIDTYNKWLSNGFQADMEYMSKNLTRRLNPYEILPDAKSVICLAVNYFNGDENILIFSYLMINGRTANSELEYCVTCSNAFIDKSKSSMP